MPCGRFGGACAPFAAPLGPALNIRICPTTNVLISDNLPVGKSYFDFNII